MATDPKLPHVLATAATRVDRVAEQLAARALATQTAAITALVGWSGPRSGVWGPACARVAKDIAAESRSATTLAATLRAAKTSAERRIYQEWLQAELEKRKAAEAAAKAAEKAKGTK
jgi:hypothetical protein